jgi:hypothetical protein
MARSYTEHVNVIQGAALNNGGRTIFSNQLPLGEGWYKMDLFFTIAFTVGTAAGITAGADYELRLIRSIQIRTDKGETICNLPGRALHKIAWTRMGTQPNRTIFAAVGAPTNYFVHIPIYFADPMSARPEDTVLDTTRYNSVVLDITMGPNADLTNAVGTGTYTATLDVDITRSKGPLDAQAKPVAHIAYDFRQPVDANVGTVIDLERSTDLWLRRLYVHSTVAGLPLNNGQPMWGTNSDAIQNVVSVQDQSGFLVRQRVHFDVQRSNKMHYRLESYADGVAAPANALGGPAITGWEVHDFMATDDSINSALFTGNKSILQYIWNNQAGVAANSFITAVTESHRTLK